MRRLPVPDAIRLAIDRTGPDLEESLRFALAREICRAIQGRTVPYDAVVEFVERYNQCWRLEKLAYRTPLEAREEYELLHAPVPKRRLDQRPRSRLHRLLREQLPVDPECRPPTGGGPIHVS